MNSLPCPFCGCDEVEVRTSTPDREGTPTNMVCCDCGACGPWVYCLPDCSGPANDAWNIRSAELEN